jgi:aminoglycoside 3-N-acetyltransferase
MEKKKFSYLDLPEFLQLKEDDTVFLASDIKQLIRDANAAGEKFDPNLLIEAFQKKLTNGTLIVPAYTDGLVTKDGVFEYEKSRPSTGAISVRVQQRIDFVRTKDPLHSVFVWGKYQKEISQLEDISTFGQNSIFAFAHKVNAKMVIINLHFQESLTFVHYVEEQLKVWYRRPYKLTVKYISNGETSFKKSVFYTRRAGVVNSLYDLQEKLIQKKISQVFKFGNSSIQVVELSPAYDAIATYIKSGGKIYSFDLIKFFKTIIKRIIYRKNFV